MSGPLALALALWLWWSPRSPDLAAQVYRVHLFALNGFSLWDENWYAGHYLPGYSLIFPALASLIGLHWTGVAAASLSTFCFSRLAVKHFGNRAVWASLSFALSAAGDLYIGRITFAAGVSFGLLAVLAAVENRHLWTVLAALACTAMSPVAGLFLLLAATAHLLSNRTVRSAIALGAPVLALLSAIALLFPEGGQEPFSFTSFLAAAGLSTVLVIVLPSSEQLLRHGAGLYVVSLLLCYLIPSPLGSNSVRLGVLFAPAIFVGAIRLENVRVALTRLSGLLARLYGRTATDAPRPGGASVRGAFALALISLMLWQIDGPVTQSVQASSDPSTQFSYYLPVISYLKRESHDRPMRIEVPFTSSHWDTVILARYFALARGWERQLDTRYDSIFYEPHLSASAYHAWLLDTAVRFVALPDASLDYSSIQEAALIRGGLPFLHEVFLSRHWRVYEVLNARPLASGPGVLTAMDDDGFTLRASAPGRFLVRIHYTPYWKLTSGVGSVSRSSGGWTELTSRRAGKISLDADF